MTTVKLPSFQLANQQISRHSFTSRKRPFIYLSKNERNLIKTAAKRYARFIGKPLDEISY